MTVLRVAWGHATHEAAVMFSRMRFEGDLGQIVFKESRRKFGFLLSWELG